MICGNYTLIFALIHFINFIYFDAELNIFIEEITSKSFLLLGFITMFSMILISSSKILKPPKIINFASNFIYFGLFCANIHYILAKKLLYLNI
ncbi:hypothetical protein [Helicobacter sp. MIT 14-3879]|uniref:hypothetical protein n=1 Tax=Helicobacter sp. MIT 14-3879 TaxID=2040649 RepID=UPI000E378A81|nr:hypothetical protein [Helicobacter sp. MIT 14-3879]RDU65534.1 hypothetical protein CQA44_00640 [Helicobacter sp. MIT 14-3879]